MCRRCQLMDLSRNLSLILAGCLEVTYLIGSILPLFVIDRFGRRFLLMFSSAGLCFCFVMVSILLSIRTKRPAYGATGFIFLFQLFYGLGWLPVPWFYPSEINTTRYRAKVQAISSAWNWMLYLWLSRSRRLQWTTSSGEHSSSSPFSTPSSSRWCIVSTRRPKDWSWKMSLYSLRKVE
ncbi:hypothetical protein EDD37DRAFT_280894 [Exophiala viscosa]|uniref:uncharacterized protein n=1 Tax=Exophiala viscosa TaxID=2486360 RepID=UPI002191710D|nr:hypothetical protein EDD37DRAFT_280894 [Exophiala viscosa]